MFNIRNTAVVAGVFLGTFAFGEAPQPVPNPYQLSAEHWANLPEGRAWGSAPAIAMDSKGDVWVFERCGANSCAGKTDPPILEFDRSGKLLTSFGADMFVFPHCIFIDKDDNVWIADADGKDGKGQVVVKFSPQGKVLMTLGKAGVAGNGPDTFNRPSGVAVAPNGDIFVSDGHGGDSNARIVKFTKDGKFVKEWGKKGTADGEFGGLHGIALDSQERVYVADRDNNRVEVFDKDGNFIATWTQFGKPSAIFIDKNDMIYVADDTSGGSRYPDWPRGVRIGNAKNGTVTAFLPDPELDPKRVGTGPESVVADTNGDIYTGEVVRKSVRKYVKH